MTDVFSEIVACLQKKERVVLATIISSDGSSPLPTGAMMLVKHSTEETIGTVGGGLLEALVIQDAKKLFLEKQSPRIGTFDLNGDVSNEGMICGGKVDVLLEPLSEHDLTAFQVILSRRDEGSDIILLRTLDTSSRIPKAVLTSKHDEMPDFFRQAAEQDFDRLTEAVHRSFGQADVRRIKTAAEEIIIQPIKGRPDLVIFGGGHVSVHLAQIASIAGFSTTVIDDREEFAAPERFPGAARVFSSDFKTAFTKIVVKPSTYIVIVTRGHASDEDVLGNAVKTSAKYIGMIGSKRKVIATFEHLIEKGADREKLRHVHAPIGLDIGAVSAEEIAVSIVAEMIRIRRGASSPSVSVSESIKSWSDKSFRSR